MDFDGSLLLEKLVSQGLMEDFMEAVDSDNLELVSSILEDAGFDEETVSEVLEQIKKGP